MEGLSRKLTHLHASTSAFQNVNLNNSSVHLRILPRRPSPHTRRAILSMATSDIITFAEVQEVALTRGVHIGLRTLGPGYRIICRDGSESGPILGVTSGFLVTPLGLMHCDALQIFTQNQKGDQGTRTRGGLFGLGVLIGGATFAFGWERNCKKAEILAINDDDAMHARLVRYYSRFGFIPIRHVTGGKLSDLPDMLVWGGAGTRMDANVYEMLERWTPIIRNRSISG